SRQGRPAAAGRPARPLESNASRARATGSSRSITRAPIAASTLRSSAGAQTAPKRPVLAPTTATGFPRRQLSGKGRDALSSAFLSAPGNEGVVLRRRDEDRVGGAESRAQPANGRVRGLDVGILAVVREFLQTL